MVKLFFSIFISFCYFAPFSAPVNILKKINVNTIPNERAFLHKIIHRSSKDTNSIFSVLHIQSIKSTTNFSTTRNKQTKANGNVFNNFVLKTDTFKSAPMREKVYLHFDKPFYVAGDTIYFKAYVTEEFNHKLSTLSGVLHVDLINSNNKIDQSIKLRLKNGIAWGDVVLPDTLPKGNYRVRAYTRWMRKDSLSVFFNKVIPIGTSSELSNLSSLLKKPIKIVDSKPDIQFFPEGGTFIIGARSKVAFKAIDINGLGINVKGIIVNQNDQQICTFSSNHLGMGYFYIRPKEGEVYKANYVYANNKTEVAPLPKPELSGIILTLNNDSIPNASVQIEASPSYYSANRDKNYSLIIYSGGKVIAFTCKLNSPVIRFDILKRKLRTGTAVISLLSPESEPLCERLFFVQNYDQLTLNLTSDKNIYQPRESVSLKINVKDRSDSVVKGHFSISVTNDALVHVNEVNENTICTNLLLTSNLKGYVEQPNYYFIDTTAIARQNLDLLVLTQGYRSFEWKKLLNNDYRPPIYQPEIGLEISGVIKNYWGSTLKGGVISLIPQAGGAILSSMSDENGIFHFNNLVFFDTTHFVLSAVKANGKNSTRIIYLDHEDVPDVRVDHLQNLGEVNDSVMTLCLRNQENSRIVNFKYGDSKGVLLKQVEIRDKKQDHHYATQSLAGAGNADQVLHSKDLLGGQLSTSLNLLRGVTVASNGTATKLYLTEELATAGMHNPIPILVIVDGAIMASPFDVNMISTSEVETIELLKYANTGIYGMSGAGGVLIITTKQGAGKNPESSISTGVLSIAPIGFYKARQFYSPKYDNTNLNNKQKDFRSTIFWKPEFSTDKNGNASVSYYNADGKGIYRVVVEGIDENGNLGRQVYKYKVE